MTALSAPYAPLGHAPLRRAHSIRRTSYLQATWPQGRHGPVRLEGAARDLLTPAAGAGAGAGAVSVAEDRLTVLLDCDRTIRAIQAGREIAALAQLLGRPSIGGLRSVIAEALDAEAAAASPLHALVEDIPGVSLICDFAWARWPATRDAEMRLEEASRLQMRGVCTGFAPESSALTEPPATASRKNRVPSLVHPLDPQGWHALPKSPGIDLCRVRRLDAWIEDGLLCVDLMFQDSAAAPNDTREAAHEYAVQAKIDLQRGLLLEIHAQPHILPYRECPGAIANLHRVLGTPVGALRRTVLGTLRRTDGCTHLNDAVRSLAEVPQLIRVLNARQP